MAVRILRVLLLVLPTVFSTPTHPYPSLPSLPLPAQTIAQFNTTSWLENIAVRSNGALLVTQLAPAPVLYTIQHPSSPNATLDSVYTFSEPNVTILLGIVETYPDTFAIIAGNATANATGYPGTFSVWEARFLSRHSSAAPTVRKVANIPAAKFLNGVIPLPSDPSILLIADSQFGLLFRLDTRTGISEVIADRAEFKPYPERQNKTVGFGINGVKIRDGYLYFSNSNLVCILRVPITEQGYVAQHGAAAVELYANLNSVTIFIDDFTFSDDGTIWAVSNDGNTVVAIAPGGRKVTSVAGSLEQLTLAGGTAGAFGRGKKDTDVLYVCTAGGLDRPVNGSVTEPGKVVGIDTSAWKYTQVQRK